jgi:hypothetical protein
MMSRELRLEAAMNRWMTCGSHAATPSTKTSNDLLADFFGNAASPVNDFGYRLHASVQTAAGWRIH